MDRILWLALPCFVLSLSLQTCTSSSADKTPEPVSVPSAEPAGVTLVLVRTHTPNGCCRVFTLNPSRVAMTVFCPVSVFGPTGRLRYSEIIPPPPRGHSRSSGFVAQPGRHSHDVFELPIDLAHDSYVAHCRPAAWHGGAPI
jgi:hypothetical protein